MLTGRQKVALIAAAILVSGCTASGGNSNASIEPEDIKPSANKPQEAPARDGPFGLAMGQPMAELKFDQSEDVEPSQPRILSSVPRPMSEIELYAALAFPETGLCEIRAVSKTYDADAYGYNIRPAMDALAVALDGKYGKSKKIDQCVRYDNCQFFQMGLKDGTKRYAYEWSKSTGANLPESIESISMFAMAGEFNDTVFRIDYRSSNRKGCDAAVQKIKAQSL